MFDVFQTISGIVVEKNPVIEWRHHRPTRFEEMIGAPGGSREKKVVCPLFNFAFHFEFPFSSFHCPVSNVISCFSFLYCVCCLKELINLCYRKHIFSFQSMYINGDDVFTSNPLTKSNKVKPFFTIGLIHEFSFDKTC